MPEQELKTPKANFNLALSNGQESYLGPHLTQLAYQVMDRLNILSKVVNVMLVKLLKGILSGDTERIKEPLSVKDIQVGNKTLLAESMGPTIAPMESGKLDSFRPFISHRIIYARSRCDKSLLALLGIKSLPILLRNTCLTKLILLESNCENHRASSSGVLARSRQRAWIIRGHYLAKEVCSSCPK